MAFQTIRDRNVRVNHRPIARRRLWYRLSRQTKPCPAVGIHFYVSVELAHEARIHIGDRVDVQIDPEARMGRICRVPPGFPGWTASSNESRRPTRENVGQTGALRIQARPNALGVDLLLDGAESFAPLDATIRALPGEIQFLLPTRWKHAEKPALARSPTEQPQAESETVTAAAETGENGGN